MRLYILKDLYRRLFPNQRTQKPFQQMCAPLIVRAKRKSTDIHFFNGTIKVGIFHILILSISREKYITSQHLFLDRKPFLFWIIIKSISITMHLIDSIIRRNIHSIYIRIPNPILCIEKVSQLESVFYITSRQLKHDIRFLWHGERISMVY